MNRRLCVSGLFALAILLAFGRPAFSQLTTTFAQLNGSVRDEHGGRIANCTVTLRAVATNRVFSAVSTEEGLYLVSNLPPGQYQLTVETSGFAKFTQSGLVLSVGQIATVDIVLKVSGVSEEVVVIASVPLVEPTRTEVSQVISTQQIQSLPISGRQFIDFALLTPGVATGRTSFQSPFTEPETTRISFAGQRDLNNGVTVDGADFLNSATSSQRATPSQEAVSEFRVVNNSFSAEYGRALGGIVNIVTKGGSNTVHGSAYEFFRNQATDSRSDLTLPEFNTLRQSQFGFTLGGPVKTDRTFFFANYEGQRRAQSPTYPAVLVQNLAAINVAKVKLGLKPENLDILKINDSDNLFLRVDHRLNQYNQFAARYLFVDSRNPNLLVGDTLDGGGVGAPSSGRNGGLRDQSFVSSLTTYLSPTMVNIAMVQGAKRRYDFKGASSEPNLDFPNLLLFGHNFGSFERVDESRVQVSDTLSLIHNDHYAKVGFDTNYVRNYVIWPGFTPARIIFPGVNCLMIFAALPQVGTDGPCPLPPVFEGVAGFFWGAPIGSGPLDPTKPSPPIPTTWDAPYLSSQAPNFDVRLNHGYHGFFAQDQWRVTPKLTLNYGLRYDVETGLGFLVEGDKNNVAPRVGIAYAPDSKTVIRGGYGTFYDRYNLTFFFISAPQRPPVIAGLPVTGNMTTGTWLLNFITAQDGPPSVPPDEAARATRTLLSSGVFPPNRRVYQGGSVVDPKSETPYSHQASVQIDREVRDGIAVNAGYLLVRAHNQVRPENLNIGLPAGTLPNGKSFFNFNKLDNNAGIYYFTDNSGSSTYHGGSVSLTGRRGSLLRFGANYTLSKTTDDGTFTVFVNTPQDLYHRDQEKADSIQDVRHRFVANFTLMGREKSALRNVELSGIATLQSARPFTIFVGFDANTDTNPVTDRVGVVGRNTYRGDTFRTLDLRLSRFFDLGNTSRRLQLMVEAFNLFDRVNINEVNTVYGAPDFIGPVPRHFGDGAPAPSPFFGTPRNVFNPRQFQFAAKLTF